MVLPLWRFTINDYPEWTGWDRAPVMVLLAVSVV